jgi:uncharacterized coiled-coil protein SlyX
LTLRALLQEKEKECSTLMRKFDARMKIELNTRRHWKGQMAQLESKLSHEQKRGMELESRLVETERVCSLYQTALRPLVDIYQSCQLSSSLTAVRGSTSVMATRGGGGGGGGGGAGSEEVFIPPFWSEVASSSSTAMGRREHSQQPPSQTPPASPSSAPPPPPPPSAAAAVAPSSTSALPVAAFCVVCQANTADTLILPCGHMCLCYSHAMSMQIDRILKVCPVCKQSCQKISRVSVTAASPGQQGTC